MPRALAVSIGFGVQDGRGPTTATTDSWDSGRPTSIE